MKEATDTATAVLQQATGLEKEGRRFYLRAARVTQDAKGKEMFGILAEDEKKHFLLIKREYNSLLSKGMWAGSPEIKPVTADLGKSIFPGAREELEKSVTSRSTDWDALLFGLDVETRCFNFYREAASQTGDALGKQMFEFLASQEESHFNMLMMRYESLFGPVSWRY